MAGKINIQFLAGAIILLASAMAIGWSWWEPELRDSELARQQSDLVDQLQKSPNPDSIQVSDPNQVELAPKAEVDRVGEVFAIMTIERLGKDWKRFVAEGTVWEPSLNTYGVGHYRGTAFPGEVGNFAVAGHRGGFGGTFRNIDQLVPGDAALLRTAEGVFTYQFLEHSIVSQDQIGVIAKVPQGLSSAKAGGKYMTITSCDPVWENTHRIIAWFELIGFEP